VLAVSELVNVARSVSADGSSPLALRAAQPWRVARVRFVRSSANHVFLCSGPDATTSVLRLRPQSDEAFAQARKVAEHATRLAASAAPVAPAIASEDGALATAVADDEGDYVATMFAAISGRQIEAESLRQEEARSWGRALAVVHDVASAVADQVTLRRWLDTVEEAVRLLRSGELREVGVRLVDALGQLPSSAEWVGVVHGDPELDNVIWQDGAPVFVDLDDAGRSWFAADVCFALRDFAKRASSPDVEAEPVAAFLAGYRERRPLGEDEVAAFPLFARAHALITLARLERPRGEPIADDWPDWAKALRAKLDTVADELQAGLLTLPR
jgi:Ser/Thr protein kinase RdoA (MazF antagonist)